MASAIDICNKALSLLGQKTITSLNDDSPEALACRLHWPLLRDEVLRGHPWNCVKTRASLNRLLVTPDFGYSYYYQLPADCLQVLSVEPEQEFEVEGRRILADSDTLDAIYIYSEDDTSQYDAQLSSAFSYLLAAELCYQMTKSTSKEEGLLKVGREKLADAKATDAFEEHKLEKRGNRFLNAKFG
jgi:hypothetical protein